MPPFAVVIVLLSAVYVAVADDCSVFSAVYDFSAYAVAFPNPAAVTMTNASSNLACVFNVLVPPGAIFYSFVSANLSQGDTNLAFFDGATTSAPLLVRMYGSQPGLVASTGSAVTVALTTDAYNATTTNIRIGLTWANVSLNYCTGVRTVNVTAAPFNLTDPVYVNTDNDSLGFPSYSPSGLPCGYLVQAPAGTVVSATMMQSHLQPGDSVIFHDGASAAGRVLGASLGNAFLVSTGRYMYLEFGRRPGTKLGFTGFSVQLSSYPDFMVCSGAKVVNVSATNFLDVPSPFATAGDGLDVYRFINLSCTFILQAPAGKVVRASIPTVLIGKDDSLYVTDSGRVIASAVGGDASIGTFQSDSNELLVHFSTSVEYSGVVGFQASFTVADPAPVCSGIQQMLVSGTSTIANRLPVTAGVGYLPTPGVVCTFNLTAPAGMELIVDYIEVDLAPGDTLTVYDDFAPQGQLLIVTHTGGADVGSLAKLVSSARQLRVVYQAGGEAEGAFPGFALSAGVYTPATPCSGVYPPAYVIYPGTPDVLPRGLNCTFLFNAPINLNNRGATAPLRLRAGLDFLRFYAGYSFSDRLMAEFTGTLPDQDWIMSNSELMMVNLQTSSVVDGHASGTVTFVSYDWYTTGYCEPYTEVGFGSYCVSGECTQLSPRRRSHCVWTGTPSVSAGNYPYIYFNPGWGFDLFNSADAIFSVRDGNSSSAGLVLQCPGPLCSSGTIVRSGSFYVQFDATDVTTGYATAQFNIQPTTLSGSCMSVGPGGADYADLYSSWAIQQRPALGETCQMNRTAINANLMLSIVLRDFDLQNGSSLVLYGGNTTDAPVLYNFTYPNVPTFLPLVTKAFFIDMVTTSNPEDNRGRGFHFFFMNIPTPVYATGTTVYSYGVGGGYLGVRPSNVDISGQTGQFMAPPYYGGQTCTFILQGRENATIIQTFSSPVYLRDSDSLIGYDGNSTSSRVLFHIQGVRTLPVVMSTGRVLRIDFVAGPGNPTNVTKSGFSISWLVKHAMTTCTPGLVPVQVAASRFMSLPADAFALYAPGLNCGYRFVLPVGVAATVSISGSVQYAYDSVSVYEAGRLVAQLTGPLQQQFIYSSACGDIDVVLQSDNQTMFTDQRQGISIAVVTTQLAAFSDTCRRYWNITEFGTVCAPGVVETAAQLGRVASCVYLLGMTTFRGFNNTVLALPRVVTADNLVTDSVFNSTLYTPVIESAQYIFLGRGTLRAAFPLLTRVGNTAYLSSVSGQVTFPVLAYTGAFVITGSNLGSFSLPALTFAYDIEVYNSRVALDIPGPITSCACMRFCQNLELSVRMPIGQFNEIDINFNVGLTTLELTSVAYLYCINSNNDLRSITIPGSTSLVGSQTTINNNYALTALNAPNMTTFEYFFLGRSRVAQLSFPVLRSGVCVSLVENYVLVQLDTPVLESVNAFTLTRSALTALSAPMLTSVPILLSIQKNLALTTLNLCRLHSVGVLTFDNNPLLSCYDTQQLFNFSTALQAQIVPPKCSPTSSGIFGCRANQTVTVDPVGCGFTVACIQTEIDRALSFRGYTVVIPAGTYTGCSTPLSFKGKAITVAGAGMGSTVVDCANSGRAITFESGETISSLLANMTFTRGQALTGGVALISDASPWIDECEFSYGTATGAGGGIAISGASSTPRLTGVVVHHNAAGTDGGGLALTGSLVELTRCTVRDNSAASQGGGLLVKAAPGALRLEGVTVAGNAASRGGGIFTDSPLTLDHVTLNRNTAGQFGGGLAAIATAALGAQFTLVGCLVTANTGRGGGGLFGFSANFILSNTTLNSNVAGALGGGGLSVTCNQNYRTFYNIIGPCTVYVELLESRLLNNSALVNGGGVLAADVMLNVSGGSFAANRAGAAGGAVYATVTALNVEDALFSSNVAATNGGGVYCEPFTGSCSAQRSSFVSNEATVAGGGVYLCTSACPNATLGDADYGALPLPPFLPLNSFSGNAVGAGGYGEQVATDPSRLSWRAAPASQSVSGRLINSDGVVAVLVTDSYDQTATSSASVLTLSLDVRLLDGEVTSDASLGGTQTALASSGVAQFDAVYMVAANTSGFGRTFNLHCRLSEISSVFLDASVLLMPCAAGQGRYSDTGPASCDDCAAGYRGSGATSDYVCEACPAGSFAATALSTACTNCAVNTHAPVAGSTSCLACPDGFTAAGEGNVECTQAAAIVSLSPAALGGTVGGVIAGLLVIFCVVAFCLYRAARRRTMQKYYLDNDATVRTGAQETPLQKEVKKIIGASSTTRIGGGLYSDVYKAKYNNDWIALKVIKGEMATNGTAQQEFRREAVALSRLEERAHPGIVKLMFFLSFNPMCIGVAFCRGGSLKRAMQNKTFTSSRERVQLIAEAASGMTVLHALNIVHLDIKTDNMLLSADNHIIIADFGIARLLGNGGEELDVQGEYVGGLGSMGSALFPTQIGSGFGGSGSGQTSMGSVQMQVMRVPKSSQAFDTAYTPQYVDPIRILFDKNNDEAYLKTADVFSFAMMMWAVFANEEPYFGENPEFLVEKLRANPLLRPHDLTECPPFYDKLMRSCWHENYTMRPTFREVFETLKTNLNDFFGVTLEPEYANPRNEPAAAPVPSTRPTSLASHMEQ